MKNTRRFISGLSALAIAAALAPMSAFATNVTPDTSGNPSPPSAGFEVTYDVDPSYTVTIPAGVDITTGDKTASITLEEGVILPEGAKIEVVLEKGAYTTTGNAFTAKTASGNSSASYQINGGNVKVGDVVASLDKDTLSADLTFSRTTTIAPTYAGTHSEVLTFGISVEDAVVVKTLTVEDVTLDYCDGDTWQQIVDRNPDKIKTTSGSGWEVRISKINGSFTSWNLCKGSIGNTNFVYADHVVDPNATYVWWE